MNDTLNFLYSKKRTPLEFMFDSLIAPSMYNFITTDDVMRLNNIATSLRFSGDINKKYKAIDEILKPRDCIKFASGTNRVVYRPLEYPYIVFKIALDSVGISDTPAEYNNQFLLKPFVTKVFEYSPCGSIGVFERVKPIRNKKEFKSIAEDVYHLLNKYILGKYVLADIGTRYYLNYGLRDNGFGPVLLDFPYVYEVDGKKLVCNVERPDNNFIPCGGFIDYDLGFNKLKCEKCGKEYLATELKKKSKSNILIITDKEDVSMKIGIFKDGVLVREVEDSFDAVPSNNTLDDTMNVVIIKKDEKGNIIENKVKKSNKSDNVFKGKINVDFVEENKLESVLPVMDDSSNYIFGISDSDFDESEEDNKEYELPIIDEGDVYDEDSDEDKYEDIVHKYGAGGFKKNQKKRGVNND